jgi:hypothetical protein
VNDYQKTEKAAANREAVGFAGRPHPRAFNAEAVDAALIRYLAAQEYHEHVVESREAAEEEPVEKPAEKPEATTDTKAGQPAGHAAQ